MAYSKESQKRYNQKRLQYNICWKSEDDKKDGERVKAYLEQTGQSANSYIKSLIKRDLDDKGFAMDDKAPVADTHNNDVDK